MMTPILSQALEHRPTVMDVDLDAIAKNYGTLRQRIGSARMMCVVKANAYGHGLLPCARLLEQLGADMFGVALVEEGIELRRGGIQAPVLVFGGITGAQIKLFLEHRLDLAASSVFKLKAINDVAKSLGMSARVHLKIDTGMERIGVHWYSADELLQACELCTHVEVVGVFSHLANADASERKDTDEQLSRFQQVTDWFKGKPSQPLRHIANSAATIQFPESHLDMVRCGISLFGIYPSSRLGTMIELEPAMTLRSQIVYFKIVRKGAGVSYGHTWIAPENTRVVTVPIGYGDGLPRRVSNRGAVLIRGVRYPIVGNVCMDQTMVSLGRDGVGYNGDDVVLIGAQGSDRITVNEVADLCDTIPYEIMTATNLRVPRRYFRGNILVDV